MTPSGLEWTTEVINTEIVLFSSITWAFLVIEGIPSRLGRALSRPGAASSVVGVLSRLGGALWLEREQCAPWAGSSRGLGWAGIFKNRNELDGPGLEF